MNYHILLKQVLLLKFWLNMLQALALPKLSKKPSFSLRFTLPVLSVNIFPL